MKKITGKEKRRWIISISLFVLVVCGVVMASLRTAPVWAAGRKIPIYSVETSSKKVALTFDAAWGADKTGAIMDILNEYGIKATFFLWGSGWRLIRI